MAADEVAAIIAAVGAAIAIALGVVAKATRKKRGKTIPPPAHADSGAEAGLARAMLEQFERVHRAIDNGTFARAEDLNRLEAKVDKNHGAMTEQLLGIEKTVARLEERTEAKS